MTTKQFLRDFRRLLKEVELKNESSRRLYALAENVTHALTGMPGGTANPHKAQHCLEEAMAMKEEAQQQMTALLKAYRHIEAVIAAMPKSAHRELLERHYIQGQNWQAVAQRMHYTDRQIYRLHNEALRLFEQLSEKVSAKDGTV